MRFYKLHTTRSTDFILHIKNYVGTSYTTVTFKYKVIIFKKHCLHIVNNVGIKKLYCSNKAPK